MAAASQAVPGCAGARRVGAAALPVAADRCLPLITTRPTHAPMITSLLSR